MQHVQVSRVGPVQRFCNSDLALAAHQCYTNELGKAYGALCGRLNFKVDLST